MALFAMSWNFASRPWILKVMIKRVGLEVLVIWASSKILNSAHGPTLESPEFPCKGGSNWILTCPVSFGPGHFMETGRSGP